MNLKTVLYIGLGIVFILLLWTQVFPTMGDFSMAPSPRETTTKNEMYRLLSEAVFKQGIIFSSTESFTFEAETAYDRNYIGIGGLFDKELRFYAEEGLPCKVTDRKDYIFPESNFTARIHTLCPLNQKHCCIGVGFVNIGEVC